MMVMMIIICIINYFIHISLSLLPYCVCVSMCGCVLCVCVCLLCVSPVCVSCVCVFCVCVSCVCLLCVSPVCVCVCACVCVCVCLCVYAFPPVLLRDVHGQHLQRLHTLYGPAVPIADARRVPLQEAVGYAVHTHACL